MRGQMRTTARPELRMAQVSDLTAAKDILPVRRERRDVNGIVLLDKPIGLSSNQALQRVKRIFGARKAGYAGTLDPLATGMLPVCFGEATKIAGYILGAEKVYRVRVFVGSKTKTGDAEGEVIEWGPHEIAIETLRAVIDRFCGWTWQIPPMYSALKRNGQRLYALARSGRDVVREPRPIMIRNIDIEQYDPHQPLLKIRCSKGTYIRTLIEDIAHCALLAFGRGKFVFERVNALLPQRGELGLALFDQ